jgi:hypothetical protein
MSDSPKKRRRLLPIVLGLVGACLVLAFIGALLSPSEEPVAPAPTSEPAAVAAQPTATPQPVATATPVPPTATPEPPTATPEPPAMAQIGDRVEAGGIALTVNSAQTMASFDFMTAAEGNTYLVVDVLLETTDRDMAPYNPLYFSVKDSDGFEHTNALIAPDPSLKSGELARGDRVRGNVAFEVPLGATGLVLTYEPLVIMGGYEPLRVAIVPNN